MQNWADRFSQTAAPATRPCNPVSSTKGAGGSFCWAWRCDMHYRWLDPGWLVRRPWSGSMSWFLHAKMKCTWTAAITCWISSPQWFGGYPSQKAKHEGKIWKLTRRINLPQRLNSFLICQKFRAVHWMLSALYLLLQLCCSQSLLSSLRPLES